MKEFSYEITDAQGIHARPAGLLVKKASEFTSKITVAKDDKEVDAKKILGIMSLGVKKDHAITIKAEGEDEAEAIEAIRTFLKENL